MSRHKLYHNLYEADVQRDGHTVTIKLDPEGKILASDERIREHGSRGDREDHEADEIKGQHRDRDEQADEEGQAEHHDWQEHSAGKMEDHDRGNHEDKQADEVGEHHHPGDEEAEDHGRTEKDDHDEILLDIHDIPRAVRATIDQHRRDGKVTKIELKIDQGHIVYAVEITQGQHETDLLISPKGRFLGREDDAAEHGNDKGRMTDR